MVLIPRFVFIHQVVMPLGHAQRKWGAGEKKWAKSE